MRWLALGWLVVVVGAFFGYLAWIDPFATLGIIVVAVGTVAALIVVERDF